MAPTKSDRLLIVDFGSQVTQLIARRVREAGVYCEIHPFQAVDKADIEKFAPAGIILSGGPASVIEGQAMAGAAGVLPMTAEAAPAAGAEVNVTVLKPVTV